MLPSAGTLAADADRSTVTNRRILENVPNVARGARSKSAIRRALYRSWWVFTRKGESKVDKKELTQSVRSAIPLVSAASSIWAAATGPLLSMSVRKVLARSHTHPPDAGVPARRVLHTLGFPFFARQKRSGILASLCRFASMSRWGPAGQENPAGCEHAQVYAAGLACWRKREFSAAAEAFARIADADPPSRLFMQRAGKLAQSPPPPDWEPINTLEGK